MFYTERTYHITAQKERDVTMIYPSGLITAKVINPDSWGTEPGPVTLPRLLRYTKHYYIGTERISSVTDTKSNLGHFIENLSYNDFFPVSTLRAMSNAQVEAAGEALEETYDHFGLEYSVPAPVVEGSKPTPGYTDFNNASIGRYFFHPDHLGSSSYITDKAGVVSQHMEYLPFGELLVDEHLNSHNSPFKFNAKELDPETGNYYYGARYYDPKWSIWLSVDPHYFNYPTFSPYAYTFQNPVKYIDPDGRDGIVAGSGTKQDPYVVTANYYHHGLSEKQASGLQAAADAFNNNGKAHRIKDGDGNNIFVQFNIGVQEAGSVEEAENLAKLDYVDLSDGSSARFGNVVSLGNYSEENHFGQAGRFNIELNQTKIDNTLAAFPGGNMSEVLKGTFIHEIGHNIGGSHGDPGSIMIHTGIDPNWSFNTLGGSGNGTFNYTYSKVDSNGIRAIMGRVNLDPGETKSIYLSRREQERVNNAFKSGSSGRLKRIN